MGKFGNRLEFAEDVQGLNPLNSEATHTEVKNLARERSKKILHSYRILHDIVSRKEESLRQRWTKKSNAQRRKTLLGCGIKLPAKHRSDYTEYLCWQESLAKGLTYDIESQRDAFLYPHLNLEDLTKVKPMLLLLNSRGHHSPHRFADGDLMAAHLGTISGALSLTFLKRHSIVLEGDTEQTYGYLVSWTKEEYKQRVESGLDHLPHEGLLVLEIQANLYDFLINWCRALLQDIDFAKISKLPSTPAPPLLIKSSEYSTLASITAEAPYRLPSKLDFSRLRAIVTAKRLGAEDYIHELREDPGLFADAVTEASDHRLERVLDATGKCHPAVGLPEFWQTAAQSVVFNAYSDLITWDIISKQLERLAALKDKYAPSIKPQERLPVEFVKELLMFKKSLEFVKRGPLRDLAMGIPASSPFRSRYCREPDTLNSDEIAAQRIGTLTFGPEDLFLLLFEQIIDAYQQSILGLPAIMDGVEHILQENPKVKAKLTPWLSRVFSDLGLLARLQNEIDLYLPWATGFDIEMGVHQDWLNEDFPKRIILLTDIEKSMGPVFAAVGALGDPTDGRYHYPCGQRRTKEITEQMQSAEKHLKYFWTKLDLEYLRVTGKPLRQVVAHICTNVRAIERTPDWVPTIESAETAPRVAANQLEPARNVPKISQSNQPPSIPQFSPADPGPSFVAPQERIKPKTRGAPAPSANSNEDVPEISTLKITERTYKLKPRAVKAFGVLFHRPSETNIPGDLRWTEFRYAMVAMGFTVHKLDGSACQFTPPSTEEFEGKHGILFHVPHSSGGAAKIRFYRARSMGRRLNNIYGWHGGMFVSE